jgi:hypothetical protein
MITVSAKGRTYTSPAFPVGKFLVLAHETTVCISPDAASPTLM